MRTLGFGFQLNVSVKLARWPSASPPPGGMAPPKALPPPRNGPAKLPREKINPPPSESFKYSARRAMLVVSVVAKFRNVPADHKLPSNAGLAPVLSKSK